MFEVTFSKYRKRKEEDSFKKKYKIERRFNLIEKLIAKY